VADARAQRPERSDTRPACATGSATLLPILQTWRLIRARRTDEDGRAARPQQSETIMAYWLFKSEPATWSWEDQVAKGEIGEEWDGVRNYQARNFMRQMQIGDRGFFYHSQKEKSVVGIVEVCATVHPDSTTDDPRWDCVDIKAVRAVAHPVTLDQIKGDPRLADMVLVRNSRLSVQPVTQAEWIAICDMGQTDPG